MKRVFILILLSLIAACGEVEGHGKIFVPRFALPHGMGHVLVYSYPDLEPLGEIDTGIVSIRLARRPLSDELWVSCEASKDLVIIDADRDSVLMRLKIGAAAGGGAFTPDGRLFVIPHGAQISKGKGASQVSIVDASARRMLATLEVGVDPFSAAVSPDGREAWVANNADNTITRIDLVEQRVIDTIETGPGPYSLTVDPDAGLLYAACRGVDAKSPGRFVAHSIADLAIVSQLETDMHPVQILLSGDKFILLEAAEDIGGRLSVRGSLDGVDLWSLNLPGCPGLGRIDASGTWLILPVGGVDLVCVDLEARKIHNHRKLPRAGINQFSVEIDLQ